MIFVLPAFTFRPFFSIPSFKFLTFSNNNSFVSSNQNKVIHNQNKVIPIKEFHRQALLEFSRQSLFLLYYFSTNTITEHFQGLHLFDRPHFIYNHTQFLFFNAFIVCRNSTPLGSSKTRHQINPIRSRCHYTVRKTELLHYFEQNVEQSNIFRLWKYFILII